MLTKKSFLIKKVTANNKNTPGMPSENLQQQIRLEEDIMALLLSQQGASMEELVMCINQWIDQGRSLDVEYAIVLLKCISQILNPGAAKGITVCFACQRKLAVKRCSACSTRYCSRECQLTSWPTHKQDCPGRRPID